MSKSLGAEMMNKQDGSKVDGANKKLHGVPHRAVTTQALTEAAEVGKAGTASTVDSFANALERQKRACRKNNMIDGLVPSRAEVARSAGLILRERTIYTLARQDIILCIVESDQRPPQRT